MFRLHLEGGIVTFCAVESQFKFFFFIEYPFPVMLHQEIVIEIFSVKNFVSVVFSSADQRNHKWCFCCMYWLGWVLYQGRDTVLIIMKVCFILYRVWVWVHMAKLFIHGADSCISQFCMFTCVNTYRSQFLFKYFLLKFWAHRPCRSVCFCLPSAGKT